MKIKNKKYTAKVNEREKKSYQKPTLTKYRKLREVSAGPGPVSPA